MSDSPAPTLGRQIDELLTPFTRDESELQQRLEQLNQEIQRLQAEINDVDRDLAVVRSAKIDALRQAAERDPLLSAAFFRGANVEDAPSASHASDSVPDDHTPDEGDDSHPLLNPEG